MAEGNASQARHKSTPQSSRFWQAAGCRSVWLVYEQVSGEHSECSCCRLSVGRQDSRASLGSWSHGELIELEFQEHPSAARVSLDELAPGEGGDVVSRLRFDLGEGGALGCSGGEVSGTC